MTREEILKEIDEVIKYNKAARGAEVTELFKDATRKSNDVLAHVRRYIDGNSEYERGLEDAWIMAGKLTRDYSNVKLSAKDIRDMYGCVWYEVFEKYTAHDALSIYEDWLKEKEEEAKKPIVGDIVEVTSPLSGTAYKGIFLGTMQPDVTYILKKDCNGPTAFRGDSWAFEKTGEHIDIFGALKGE